MRHGDLSPLRRTFPVPGGPHVRLRLAGPSDRASVQALLEFDPGRRRVLAAFALLDGHDTLVGIGSIENGEDAPDILVVDERLSALSHVLGRVLVERARVRRAA
jgi:hypothetical protein